MSQTEQHNQLKETTFTKPKETYHKTQNSEDTKRELLQIRRMGLYKAKVHPLLEDYGFRIYSVGFWEIFFF